ncbi:MAG: group III truncated hemoglobin [Acetobacteraceae bacterium]|nr:group III truncated hemoglobin [Acetobacteraceae bacterium]
MEDTSFDPVSDAARRRAAATAALAERTGLSETLLERVVREFYGTARHDPLLGPVFARIEHWEPHIARITDFWSSVALQTGRYHGAPMEAHLPLGLTPAHFARWLALWEETVARLCPPEGAALLADRARRIADSLGHAMAVRAGQLLPLRAPHFASPAAPGTPTASPTTAPGAGGRA